MPDPQGKDTTQDVIRRAFLSGLLDAGEKKLEQQKKRYLEPGKGSMLAPFLDPIANPVEDPKAAAARGAAPPARVAPTAQFPSRPAFQTQTDPGRLYLEDKPSPGPFDVAIAAIARDPYYATRYFDFARELQYSTAEELLARYAQFPFQGNRVTGAIGVSTASAIDYLALSEELERRVRYGEVTFSAGGVGFALRGPDPRAIGVGAGRFVVASGGGANYPVAVPPALVPGVIQGGELPGTTTAPPPMMLPPSEPGAVIPPRAPSTTPLAPVPDPNDNRGNRPRVPGLPDDLFRLNPPDP